VALLVTRESSPSLSLMNREASFRKLDLCHGSNRPWGSGVQMPGGSGVQGCESGKESIPSLMSGVESGGLGVRGPQALMWVQANWIVDQVKLRAQPVWITVLIYKRIDHQSADQ
jgi:hypothetical protein